MPVRDRQEGTQALADQAARAVCGDEIALVGEILDVERDAPRRRFPADHCVSDQVGWHQIDVRRVAKGPVAIVETGANLKSRYAGDREPVGGPEVGHISRHALRVVADGRDCLRRGLMTAFIAVAFASRCH